MLKKRLKSLVFLSLFSPSIYAAQLNTLDYLLAMMDAHQQRNFELLYIMQRDQIESFRYRHAKLDEQEYAQQINLENAREEIVLSDDVVSYSGNGGSPFSLYSRAIWDNLPAIFHADFIALANYYDFVEFGRERIADRIARGIRIVPKENDRYRYTVWVDENSGLLLKSELTDFNENPLEQFRVVQAIESDQLLNIVEPIKRLLQPIQIQPENAKKYQLNWQLNWLPNGFKQQGNEQRNRFILPEQNADVESRYYSDGLFSFTVYVLDDKNAPASEHFWQENSTTIYMRTNEGKVMVLIGTVPVRTAQRILQHLQFEGGNQ